MNEPFFVNTYNAGELMGNLNALVAQGYEVVNITGHHFEGGSEFTVVAKDRTAEKLARYVHLGILSLAEMEQTLQARKPYKGTITAKPFRPSPKQERPYCECHLHYHQCCDFCTKTQTKNDILKLLKKAYDIEGIDSVPRLVHICKTVREILEANRDK